MFHTAEFVRRHRNWCLFSITTAACLIACFQQVALATVSGDIAASLRVDSLNMWLLTAAFTIPYAMMQIPAGILSDTVGARKTLTVALLLAAVGTVAFASAAGLGAAIGARMLMGFSLAVIAVPQMKLLAVWFPVSAYSRLTAISFAISSMGPLMATSPMAFAASNWGWRTPFMLLAVVSVLFAFLIWKIVRDCPDKIEELVNIPGSGQGIANIAMRNASSPRGERLRRKLDKIVRSPAAWKLGFWYFCQGGIYFAFVGLWGGQYLTSGLGLSTGESGWVLSLAACSLVTAPLFSWLTAKIGSPRRMLLILSACSVALWVPMCLGLPKLPNTVLMIYFLALSVAAYGGAAIVFVAAKEHFEIELAGTVSGFINMFAFVGGALLQQLIGLSAGFWLGAGMGAAQAISRSFLLMLLAACASLVLAWRYREATATQTGAREKTAVAAVAVSGGK